MAAQHPRKYEASLKAIHILMEMELHPISTMFACNSIPEIPDLFLIIVNLIICFTQMYEHAQVVS